MRKMQNESSSLSGMHCEIIKPYTPVEQVAPSARDFGCAFAPSLAAWGHILPEKCRQKS